MFEVRDRRMVGPIGSAILLLAVWGCGGAFKGHDCHDDRTCPDGGGGGVAGEALAGTESGDSKAG